MNHLFKPQVELLEGRVAMSAAGTTISSTTDLVIDSFNPSAGAGRISGVVADPADAAAHFDNEWRYVTVRRTALADAGDGNVIYVSTQGGGVWKTVNGGSNDQVGPFFELSSLRSPRPLW